MESEAKRAANMMLFETKLAQSQREVADKSTRVLFDKMDKIEAMMDIIMNKLDIVTEQRCEEDIQCTYKKKLE